MHSLFLSMLQEKVKVVMEGEAEGTVSSLQTQTLSLQWPSTPMTDADVQKLVPALEKVYTDAGKNTVTLFSL